MDECKAEAMNWQKIWQISRLVRDGPGRGSRILLRMHVVQQEASAEDERIRLREKQMAAVSAGSEFRRRVDYGSLHGDWVHLSWQCSWTCGRSPGDGPLFSCGAGCLRCLCGVLVDVGVGQHQHLRWASLQAVGCTSSPSSRVLRRILPCPDPHALQCSLAPSFFCHARRCLPLPSLLHSPPPPPATRHPSPRDLPPALHLHLHRSPSAHCRSRHFLRTKRLTFGIGRRERRELLLPLLPP